MTKKFKSHKIQMLMDLICGMSAIKIEVKFTGTKSVIANQDTGSLHYSMASCLLLASCLALKARKFSANSGSTASMARHKRGM